MIGNHPQTSKPAYLYRVGDTCRLGKVIDVDPDYETGFVFIKLEDGRIFRQARGELF